MTQRGSRREALRAAGGAAAVGAALLLEGCGAHKNTVKTKVAVHTDDLVLLRALLDLEYKTIAAYEAGIPLLEDPGAATEAQQFLRHELSHAGELRGLIKKGGVKKGPKPRPSYNLGHPRTSHDVLTLLHELEREQVIAYLGALPQLSNGAVRGALAAVLANDAQHISVLRTRLHVPPAPAAFVTGRE